MSTYAQEKAEKDAAKAKRSQKFVYEPVLFDRIGATHPALVKGALVVKTQPYGCPKNGTMGMCYVADADTGTFIGMVCVNSLKKVSR